MPPSRISFAQRFLIRRDLIQVTIIAVVENYGEDLHVWGQRLPVEAKIVKGRPQLSTNDARTCPFLR